MTDFKVDKIKRETLSQQVIDQIVLLITDGHLTPGDKLPSELKLIEQFGVSRPVLREALSSLETLEIVTRRPRGGTYINEKIGSSPFKAMLAISINNIPAVIEARMTLELGLVTMAAQKINEDELAELLETIHSIEKAKDENYGIYDKQFHRIIAYSVSNPILEGMIDSLLLTHEKMDSLIKYEDREPEKTIDQHYAIYEALKKGDPIESFEKMYEHLNYVRGKVLKTISLNETKD